VQRMKSLLWYQSSIFKTLHISWTAMPKICFSCCADICGDSLKLNNDLTVDIASGCHESGGGQS
jgi:hypothetical protein